MSSLIILAFDVLVDQMIFSLVVENNVHFFRRVATDIGTEHNVVLGLAVHVFSGDR